MSRRIVFMGAGAVGGYIGGHFARIGEDVTLIDPWPEHIGYIKHIGIPAPTHAALTAVAKRVELREIEAHPRNVEKL